MNLTPRSFQPKFNRQSFSSVKKEDSTTPPSTKLKMQNLTPTNYNTPASKYQTLISQNSQLTEQLAIKSIQLNTLRLYIQNLQQSSNSMLSRITEQNRELLKEITNKEQHYSEFIEKHMRSVEKLEAQFRDLKYQKQREIKLLKQELSNKNGMDDSSSSLKFPNPKYFQTQIDKLINMFTIMNTDPQKLKYLKSNINLNMSSLSQHSGSILSKQNNFNIEESSKQQMSIIIIKLKQQIAVRDTDIRLLKEQIHSLTSTFSEQISNMAGEITLQKQLKQQLQQSIKQLKQQHQKQLKKIQSEHKQYINEWSRALIHINQKQCSGIKMDISQLQAQNVQLSKQLEDKISKLIQGDLQNCNLSMSRERMEEQYNRFLQKQNQIISLKLEIKKKQENIIEILEKYKKLESELERMQENNLRIMEISRRRIVTEEVRVEEVSRSNVKSIQEEGQQQQLL